MTPEDIRSQRFGMKLLGGLNAEEVRAFLEDVADAYEIVQQHNAQLEAKVRSLRKEVDGPAEQAARTSGPDAPMRTKELVASGRLEGLRSAALQEIEALLHDAQLQADALIAAANTRAAAALQDAEAVRGQKEQEVEHIIEEARATAETIIREARQREAALREDIAALTDGRYRLLDDARATVEAYQEWLTTMDPRRRALASPDRYALAEPESNGARSMDDATAVG